MELGVAKSVFPKWTANVHMAQEHGVEAAQWAKHAIDNRGDAGVRLDSAVRAMTSLDHTIDSVQQLPVQWLVPGASKYFRGYAIAKQAVTLLAASGLVPAAQERIGHSTLVASREEFLHGVDAARADSSRYGRAYSTGWISNAIEDAASASLLLRSELGRSLMQNLANVHRDVRSKRTVDQRVVNQVVNIYNEMAAAGMEQIERASVNFVAPAQSAAKSDAVFAQTDALLKQAAAASQGLVGSLPSSAKLDQLASKAS